MIKLIERRGRYLRRTLVKGVGTNDVNGICASYLGIYCLIPFFESNGLSRGINFIYDMSDFGIDMCWSCLEGTVDVDMYERIVEYFFGVTVVGVKLYVGNMWNDLGGIFEKLGLDCENLKYLEIVGMMKDVELVRLNVEVLSKCQNLRKLRVKECHLMNVQLEGLRKLRLVDFDGCEGIIRLGIKKKLRFVRLPECRDLDFLRGCDRLRYLSVRPFVMPNILSNLHTLCLDGRSVGYVEINLGELVGGADGMGGLENLVLRNWLGPINLVGRLRSVRSVRFVNCTSLNSLDLLNYDTLEEFEISDCGDVVVDFLRWCFRLKVLRLCGVSGLFLDFLIGCPGLIVFELRDCDVADLEGLGGCLRITHLEICNCDNIVNFDVVGRLARLKVVKINCLNGFYDEHCDFRWMGNLVDLECVEIVATRLEDGGDFFGGLKKLKSLVLKFVSDVEDADFLRECVDLRSVTFEDCNSLANVEVLRRLDKLKYVCINWCNRLRDFGGIENSKVVELLGVQELTLGKLEFGKFGIGKMKRLVVRDSWGVRDLSCIGKLKLRSLEVWDCYKLRYVGRSRSIRYVRVGRCRNLTNMECLGECKNLKGLFVSRCRNLVDIGCLEGCKRLRYVDINRCRNLMRLGTNQKTFVRMSRCPGVGADVSGLNLWWKKNVCWMQSTLSDIVFLEVTVKSALVVTYLLPIEKRHLSTVQIFGLRDLDLYFLCLHTFWMWRIDYRNMRRIVRAKRVENWMDTLTVLSFVGGIFYFGSRIGKYLMSKK